MILSPDKHEDLYGTIIDRFTTWATGQTGIQAAMIVGSRARTDHPADPWSDLDIVLFADDPSQLLEDTAWLHHLGDPAITFVHGTPVGGWAERRVLFRNGCDVDIPIMPAGVIDRLATPAPDDSPGEVFGGVVHRGYRILLDRSGGLEAALVGTSSPGMPDPPTQAMLDTTLAEFWYHCVWTVKKLQRGELYTAHDCLDGYLRYLMMRLVRWTAERRGDTWHSMRFMEEWAPQEVIDLLPQTWARHTRDEIQRAMERMMDIVSLLSERFGQEHGFVNRSGEETVARELVRQLSEYPRPAGR
jgi:aminoglycoside 6-adenylyltransferase